MTGRETLSFPIELISQVEQLLSWVTNYETTCQEDDELLLLITVKDCAYRIIQEANDLDDLRHKK